MPGGGSHRAGFRVLSPHLGLGRVQTRCGVSSIVRHSTALDLSVIVNLRQELQREI